MKKFEQIILALFIAMTIVGCIIFAIWMLGTAWLYLMTLAYTNVIAGYATTGIIVFIIALLTIVVYQVIIKEDTNEKKS
jgi:hypothetical protein